MLDPHLVTLLVKLAVAASLASIVVRLGGFERMLMREERTLAQRVKLALACSLLFGASVAARIVTGTYTALDLGLEGSLLAGLVGGYVSGLLSGVLISIPAMINHEFLSMPLYAGLGVMGGLVRDLAPDSESVWRFSPFFDLGVYRMIRRWRDYRQTLFQILYLSTILGAEFIRHILVSAVGSNALFSLYPNGDPPLWPGLAAIYASTLFSVSVPLKIWNNTRNERKLEAQQRSLTDARLAALSSQINPHFLFNTLNSVSSLIRTNPEQARAVVYKLSKILRRLLRKHENMTPLRDELAFIEDYLAIEMVRFGSKLKFVKDVAPESLDMPVPSMMLQPLVENSIRHGLSGKLEGGTIVLRSRMEEGKLHLVVEDDGVGIPEAKLATLFEQGIGVSNVNSRLKVLFGNSYRMWIDSRTGGGTRTEIAIPAASAQVLAAVS